MNSTLVFGVVIVAAFIFLRYRSSSSGAYASITAADAKALSKKQKVVFLDVRTAKEIAEGKIGNATEADVMSADFKQKISHLDKDQTYIVYCRSGRRSRLASRIMTNAGFKNIYNLNGGINDWK